MPRELPLETSPDLLPPLSFSHLLLRGKECGVGYSSLWTDIMKVISNSYRIYRRQVSGYFYFVDETLRKPKHTSLQTKDPKQAQRILDARLMGRTLPAMAAYSDANRTPIRFEVGQRSDSKRTVFRLKSDSRPG